MADHNEQHGSGGSGGGGHDAHADGHKKHKKHHPHRHEEHEHEEGWIVSFADNVLLQMGFFVILLALNLGPKGTSDAQGASSANSLIDFAIEVREAFNSPVDMNSTAPEDQPLIERIRTRDRKGDTTDDVPEGDGHKPQTVRPSDWQGPGAYVQFDSNSTLVTDEMRKTIHEIATPLKGSRWMIEVRGHASRFETFRDQRKARELAYNRAWAVGIELVQLGLSWDQIRLVSSGDAAPVLARARTKVEAQTNQRTEILVLNEQAPPDPFSSPGTPAATPGSSAANAPASPTAAAPSNPTP